MAEAFRFEGGSPDMLNLGAGRKPLAGAINHDLRLDPERPWVTVAHDLNVLPWPWPDESFRLVVARAVLEHLRINLVESLNECWRILAPGGQLVLKLPYWQHEVSYIDPTHYWRFSPRTVEMFDPETEYGRAYGFYTDRKWRIVKGPALNQARSSIHATLEVRK